MLVPQISFILSELRRDAMTEFSTMFSSRRSIGVYALLLCTMLWLGEKAESMFLKLNSSIAAVVEVSPSTNVEFHMYQAV